MFYSSKAIEENSEISLKKGCKVRLDGKKMMALIRSWMAVFNF